MFIIINNGPLLLSLIIFYRHCLLDNRAYVILFKEFRLIDNLIFNQIEFFFDRKL